MAREKAGGGRIGKSIALSKKTLSPDFPNGSVGKESACNARDLGSIPRSGRLGLKEIATHSSTLAWRIPWTEEPGRLQSMGWQRIRHNCATTFHFSA